VKIFIRTAVAVISNRFVDTSILIAEDYAGRPSSDLRAMQMLSISATVIDSPIPWRQPAVFSGMISSLNGMKMLERASLYPVRFHLNEPPRAASQCVTVASPSPVPSFPGRERRAQRSFANSRASMRARIPEGKHGKRPGWSSHRAGIPPRRIRRCASRWKVSASGMARGN